MSKNFYRAFEDKHRGSRQLIKGRLEAYMPFVKPLLDIYPEAQAIDLGCGRGEWLELLGEVGFNARGVDLDEGMLQACRELNLKTELMDALTALRQLPDSSQAIVSAFHLIEHIPFEVLLALVEEAKRVLVPAGLLIFETPNPENLIVGTSSFYLDPTHVKPIPPLLLAFLPEYVGGYSKIKMVGLQEPAQKAEYALELIDIFTNVSPDYALIAQSQAPSIIAEQTSAAFFVERGVTLPMISTKFDEQLRLKFGHAEALSQQALQRAEEAIKRAEESMREAMKAERALVALHNSHSWKLTAPLRWVSHQLSLLKQHGIATRLKLLIKKIARPFIRLIVKVLRAYPRLFSWTQAGLKAFNAQYLLKKLSSRVSGTDELPPVALQNSYLQLGPCSFRAEKTLDTLKIEIKKRI
ncbi:class I SAM-dependent methyltransferase [Zwartia vadi]|uniref:class I SAM-dependent methyltransferase n=1 Tax=Zwartia vadi TaxID=3058168 RepID=UPI0025B5BC09|nr:class I SAM-dependent methyltransferase [Zwartia vadi]MDN3988223.1 methyltransferase domain-containing protein [Zwartia vadi]